MHMILATFLVLSSIKVVSSDGIISVRYISYENKDSTDYLNMCCDNGGLGWCYTICDNYFTLCARPLGADDCFVRKQTGVFNDDNIKFANDLGNGETNPVTFEFKGIYKGVVSLDGDVWDHDLADVDDLIDLFSANITVNAKLRQTDAGEIIRVINGTHTKLVLGISVYCKDNYYGAKCHIHCIPEDSEYGHYECDPKTGAKICNRGWKGPLCNLPTCRPGCSPTHGNCKKPDECRCSEGWTGANCTECVPREGCQHGFCKNGMDCICETEWSGHLCQIDLNSCRSAPCQNGGKCSNNGPDSYLCHCRFGSKGNNCEIEQEPCLYHHEYNGTGRTIPHKAAGSTPFLNDQDLEPGWYHINNAHNGKLLSTCPPIYSCGTKYPMYVDGAHPTIANTTVQARLCVSSCHGCCHMSMDIKIKACRGDHFFMYVYKLKPPLSDEMGLCVE